MVNVAKGLLAETARERNAKGYKMHLIVTSHDGETIPGHLRYQWAQKALGGDPNIIVHSAHNSLEHISGYGKDYNGEGYTSDWGFWGKVATEMCELKDTIDFYFGSESYVPEIAKACGAEPMDIDQDRSTIHTSGTIMRQSPYRNWGSFPDAVKPFFAKKICIVGAPYTGKADLAKELAADYNTVLISEASKRVYNSENRGASRRDFEKIASLHKVQTDALLEQSNRVIISDTDIFLTKVWYETVFGQAPSERMQELADQKRFDLYVLTDTHGVDFRPSNSFPSEESWHNFTKTIQKNLNEKGWPYIHLKENSSPKRFTNSVIAIDDLRWKTSGPNKMSWVPGLQEEVGYIVGGKKI